MMIRRTLLLILCTLSCAACDTEPTPDLAGHDALGMQVYSIEGTTLLSLEAIANSSCTGVTRPFVKTLDGTGDDMSMRYTCE